MTISLLGERTTSCARLAYLPNDGSNTGSSPNHDGLLGVKPDEVSRAPHYTPLQGLRTGRYPGGVAVPPLTGGMGIAPIIGRTVTLSPFGYWRRSYSLMRFRANGSHKLSAIVARACCPLEREESDGND